MNTAEMYLQSQKDGKTYICKEMRYNKKLGFHSLDKNKWTACAFKYVDDILNLNEWRIIPENGMLKKEAELKFNIKIID